jgi:hypothetical protein
MNEELSIVLERESVCAGDDIDAPHRREMRVSSRTSVAQLLETIRRPGIRGLFRSKFLPHIAGGRATWVAEGNRALALIAQECFDPYLLVDGNAPVASFFRADSPPHLVFRYLAQAEPSKAVEAINNGRDPRGWGPNPRLEPTPQPPPHPSGGSGASVAIDVTRSNRCRQRSES